MNWPFIDSHGRAVVAPGFVALILCGCLPLAAAEFSTLEPLLQEHCVECHEAKEPEGGLVLESAVDLLKGGESGPAIVAGKSAESLLVKVLEGNWGKIGKNQFMPPGKREKLKPGQIALFKQWIDSGAPLPVAASAPRELTVPRIEPRGTPRRPVNALAFEPNARLLAVARSDAVDLLSLDSRAVVRSLTGFRGSANAVVFSPDGQTVLAGTGDATGGEVQQWKVSEGTPIRVLGRHKDAVYALAITSDGQTLATGGYDYAIKLWALSDGAERTHITANQGAIMGLAFRADGRLLASVGYDRTAKIYDAVSGTRLETFGQALKELNAVAFSPDGSTLLTGGNDNRIRSYRIGSEGKEGSNELVATVFAHEGAILRLAYSPDGRTVASSADDRTVKLFDAPELKPRLTLERQPDWPTALVFAGNDVLIVGRADGSLAFVNPADGQPAQRPKPELLRTVPRGVERGTTAPIRLVGKNLDQVSVVSLYRGGKLWSTQAPEVVDGQPSITVNPTMDEPLGAWEISVGNGTVESGRVKLWVDDLPQLELTVLTGATAAPLAWPGSTWLTLEEAGMVAHLEFQAKSGQTLVLDVAAQRLGAKGDLNLTLLDDQGRTVAANDTYAGQADPLLVFRVPADGTYRLRLAEATYAGSADHFARLSLGELPLVTGIFPLTVSTNTATEVEVLGVNLRRSDRIKLATGRAGEQGLPEPAREWRSRREWKFEVSEFPTPLEVEPNEAPSQATSVPIPVAVNGRLKTKGTDSGSKSPGLASPSRAEPDEDFFRFQPNQGVTYVLETSASRRGSPVDTRIEVLWSDGRPVEQVRLQALRNSAITFRPETSDETGIRFENWEEMELNDLLWCGGEVMKLFRAPQGPDSDSALYSANGMRRGFFDTTPMAHYLEEPVFFVKPLAAGEKPVPNGLPVFTLNTVNEDAALRDIGTDSRIHFTAPAGGEFLVRVTDARQFSGPEFAYTLVIREAQPDFVVTLNGASPVVAAGSGQSFNFSVKRQDGFEGAIRLALNHLPTGWTVAGPLVIEAGHSSMSATLNVAPNAGQPSEAEWDAVTVVATADVEGRPVAVAVNTLGRPKLAKDVPKLLVQLEPIESGRTNAMGLPVVEIAPGGTARAKLRIVRQGFDGVVTFSMDNLPHGVIVENLGLNGITFLAGENEREISLSAVKWVTHSERPFYAVENQVGRQTSQPLLLRVGRERTQAEVRSP